MKARLGSVCPGGAAGRLPLPLWPRANSVAQYVSQLSLRRTFGAVPEMAECFAWLRLRRLAFALLWLVFLEGGACWRDKGGG